MKKIISILVVIASPLGIIKAQIGIGNSEPKATLDITGKADNNSPDGILIPRYDAIQLGKKDNAYGAAQNGMLVFVTDGIGNTPKTINIKTVGFYYYDAQSSIWKAALENGNQGSIGIPSVYHAIFDLGPEYVEKKLSDASGVPSLPVLDGLMLDVHAVYSSSGFYGFKGNYHPYLYNTTSSDIAIYTNLTLGDNGRPQIISAGRTQPAAMGNNYQWYRSHDYLVMMLWIKEKLYKVEYYGLPIAGSNGNGTNSRHIFIMTTRLY
ncbi:hypothetical protein ACM46_21370 [Chryseobacterium angstadtii]|uniref:Uncharacterized protein n=1 Tax=Chryseobacterium angstadtii TaxID=558151 RepID=A0A0J7KMS0_9FLAO|nr:hypothetical protein [Chryseobacterium angstadtii]KMQ58595.1 hypothetical protein ACM46_21370 [Chryseobacterium angstadtii]